jgi:hypothetical protein
MILIAAICGTAACDPNQLAPAQVTNTVDTVTMGALSGAALNFSAAFDITIGQAVRTDQTAAFDFVYTIDAQGRSVLLPIHAIPGLGNATGSNPGFIRSTESFGQIATAPTDNYLTTDTLVIAPNDVLIARSRVACYLGVPQYAKLRVIDFDNTLKTVRLEVLADINCGYKNLQPGIPTD